MPETDLRPVTIYTDGGADPNPGPGGWAAILIDEDSKKVRELSGGERHTTNNRMELTAAIHGLEALKRRCRVTLHTDSMYLKKGVTEWLPGWEARGFRRKDGELLNADLWRRLAELRRVHELHWKWVKGHAGHRHNERADELATLAVRAQKPQARTAARPDAEVFLRTSTAKGGGGWAALVRRGDVETVLKGRGPGSSNQLDILAAATSLESLPQGLSVAVHTGSDYLRKGAAQWLAAWKLRNWLTQEGKPVANRPLWQRLDAALAGRKVLWPEVKGREVPEIEALAAPARQAAIGKET